MNSTTQTTQIHLYAHGWIETIRAAYQETQHREPTSQELADHIAWVLEQRDGMWTAEKIRTYASGKFTDTPTAPSGSNLRAVAFVIPHPNADVYIDDVTPPGGHAGKTDANGYVSFAVTDLPITYITAKAEGFKDYRVDGLKLPPGNVQIRIGVPADPARPNDVILKGLEPLSRRPAPVKQAPLPPFDESDQWGNVHTTLPPDLVIPSGPDRGFWRGDIGGVMLPKAPPFVNGANTTPPEMTMSYLLPKYVGFGTKQIDDFMTAHAERAYSHFHLDLWQADAAGVGDGELLSLIEYVQSWGFFTSMWLASSAYDRSGGWTSVGPRVTAFLDLLLKRKQDTLDRFIALPGGELNNNCSPESSDAIITNVAARCNPVGIPVWLHFTPNYPGYPPQALVAKHHDNIDTALVEWWQQWIGRVNGICWQGDQNHSAGLMGAKMWDTRRILGWADPSFKTVAFELLATNQLYHGNNVGPGGHVYSEEYGCLRGYEMLCCPNAPGYNNPPVAGFGNGGRLPDGSPI